MPIFFIWVQIIFAGIFFVFKKYFEVIFFLIFSGVIFMYFFLLVGKISENTTESASEPSFFSKIKKKLFIYLGDISYLTPSILFYFGFLGAFYSMSFIFPALDFHKIMLLITTIFFGLTFIKKIHIQQIHFLYLFHIILVTIFYSIFWIYSIFLWISGGIFFWIQSVYIFFLLGFEVFSGRIIKNEQHILFSIFLTFFYTLFTYKIFLYVFWWAIEKIFLFFSFWVWAMFYIFPRVLSFFHVFNKKNIISIFRLFSGILSLFISVFGIYWLFFLEINSSLFFLGNIIILFFLFHIHIKYVNYIMFFLGIGGSILIYIWLTIGWYITSSFLSLILFSYILPLVFIGGTLLFSFSKKDMYILHYVGLFFMVGVVLFKTPIFLSSYLGFSLFWIAASFLWYLSYYQTKS